MPDLVGIVHGSLMKNQAEIENWNGPVGERWALLQEAMDARIHVFGKHVLTKAELREGARVLDVGAGCGDLTLAAARTVGTSGKVVGVDVSKPMLARAGVRAEGLANVELIEHDAATFTPDAPFDAVISRFGVMFFDEPIAAFTNLRSATKAGGALTFVCWQPLTKNPWAAVPLSAFMRVLPPPPEAPPNMPGPFAFADPDYTREVLVGAGWRDIVLASVVHPIELGDTLDAAVEYASKMGPAVRLLRDADEATQGRAVEALRETLAAFAPGFTLDGAVWLVTARA